MVKGEGSLLDISPLNLAREIGVSQSARAATMTSPSPKATACLDERSLGFEERSEQGSTWGRHQ